MFYVYLLKSLKNDKTYVGFTSKEPEVRLQKHNWGSNEFTRKNGPWKLVYYEEFSCKKCAMKREKFFKTGFGKKIRRIMIEGLS
jgi:putative endonuclease